MARPALRKTTRSQQPARPRLAHLDLDRSLVDAARADPARFDALYRKYVAQVYNYAVYELGDHHEAEDATERTFLSALAGLPRFEERALPEDGEGASTFRIWLFRIARNVVNERRRRWRRRPEAPLDLALAAPDPTDIEHAVVEREIGDVGVAGGRSSERGSPTRRHPAFRPRDVDCRDRRDPRPVGGSGPGPDPSRPARRRTRPARPPRGEGVTVGSSARDGEIEAFVVDRYLESLLARAPRDTTDVPEDLRATADRLATGLPRYHPSFRFEDELAARLALAAGSATGTIGEVIDFRAPRTRDRGATDDGRGQVRPVVIGGVLTSAAISLAAAWMAWRRGRPPADPMMRAVRAVARTRIV